MKTVNEGRPDDSKAAMDYNANTGIQQSVTSEGSMPTPSPPPFEMARTGRCSQLKMRTLLLAAIASLFILIFQYNSDASFFVQNVVCCESHNTRTLQSYASPDDQTIHAQERLHHDFQLGGYLFKETGRSYFVNADITSCLIHSFSPYVEREAEKRFVDPARDNIYYANSPAVLFFRGEMVLVTRIWLDREIYEPNNDWPSNHFADNYLYTQKFDHHLKPINNGSIVGIPSPKQWWVGDGPIEPRLFQVKNRLFVTFNAAMAFKQQYYMDFTIMWDLERNIPIIPKITGGTPMANATEPNDMPRDKHWMALIQNDELFFVHNLDPLRIMKCSLTGFCDFVHNDKNKDGFIFEHSISHLRGGTPFVVYKHPYYISVAHSTMYKSDSHHRYYTAHIVVLRVDPYRVVYVSDDLKVHPQVYLDAPMVRPLYIDDGFIFPVGLILENKDHMTLGVHVNDFSSILVRFKGMEKLMETIMKLDKRQKAKSGPPVGYLHQHVHDTQQNLTNVKFVHR